MKARWFFAFLWLLSCVMSITLILTTPVSGDSVNLEKRWVRGAVVYVITADLNDSRIRVDIGLPARGIPHSESFPSMVRRRAPLAAVTGTYFDTRTLYPVGSIVIAGKPAFEGAIGTAVCFLKPNGGITCAAAGSVVGVLRDTYTVKFASTKKGERFPWTGVETGFRAGPRLLMDGFYALNPRPEGFRQRGLFGARKRMALGLTPRNKLLLVSVSTPVTFGRLASIMKALGAVDAVALDGGASSAMYYKGRFVRRPGRALTNIIEIRQENMVANSPVRTSANTSIYELPIRAERPTSEQIVSGRPSPSPFTTPSGYDQNANLPGPPDLGAAKGRHAVFPINGAKLSRLKGLDHAKHLVHVAPNGKVVNHLVA